MTASPNATVSFDHGAPYPLTIADPFDEVAEARLAWYFEEHLRFPFTNQVLARQAAQSITTYGEALFEQVFKLDPEVYAAYRQASQGGLQGLYFEIIGQPAFQQLHWEALREPGRDPFVLHAAMVRRSGAPIQARLTVRESSTLNLLLVAARPHGRRDVGYRTISRPLIEGLRQVQLPVQVDLVRPGSYRALVERLRDKGVGYYHLIHFDLHGAVMSYQALAQVEALSPHTYEVLLKDRYGRPDLDPPPAGEAEALKAFLFFEAERPNALDPAEAGELAHLLREYQLPIAILNACQSGRQVGASETSLGSRLLQAGVQTVIAMGYSVTVSAAELMMQTLYRALLAQGDLLPALREARLALHNQKGRRAYFNQRIKLEDWLLPVVYQPQGEIPTRLPLREMTLAEGAAFWSQRGAHYQAPEPTYGFVGRDVDILQIEKHLLSYSEGKRRNLLLVRGMGGAGKTTLLHHLVAWWQTTGLVEEVFYFGYDEGAYTAAQIVDRISRGLLNKELPQGLAVSPAFAQFQALQPALRQQTLAQKLRAESHLLILDNLESVTGQFLAIPNTLPPAEQAALHAFLAELLDGRTLVLLGSRGGETWLLRGSQAPLRPNDVYELPGLDPEAASTLAERVLERHVPDEGRRASYRQSQAFQDLLKLLDGYPLPLEVVLANLANQAPDDILTALQEGDLIIDPQAKDTVPEARTKSIIRCIEYSHGKLDKGAQQLLLCLFPFSGVIWQNQLDNYAQHLGQQPALAELPFERWAEVLKTAQDWGLLTPHEIGGGYLRLQPTFPYFLKTRLEQEPAEVRQAIETAFRQHYDGLSLLLSNWLISKEPQEKQIGQILAQVEYENVYTALHLALAAQESILNPYRALACYLNAIQDHRRGLILGEMVLEQLENYPAEALGGSFGAELVAVTDDIANRQLLTQQYALAEATYLQIYQDFDDRYSQASTHHQLGRVAEERRQWDQAEAYYQQALQIKKDYNDRYSQATTYHQLGVVAEERQQWDQAEAYYQQALQIKKDYNDHYSQASIYHQLGMVAQARRQWEQAQAYFLQDLEISAEYDDPDIAITLRSLARLWQAQPDEGLPGRVGAVLNLPAAEARALLEKILAADQAGE